MLQVDLDKSATSSQLFVTTPYKCSCPCVDCKRYKPINKNIHNTPNSFQESSQEVEETDVFQRHCQTCLRLHQEKRVVKKVMSGVDLMYVDDQQVQSEIHRAEAEEIDQDDMRR